MKTSLAAKTDITGSFWAHTALDIADLHSFITQCDNLLTLGAQSLAFGVSAHPMIYLHFSKACLLKRQPYLATADGNGVTPWNKTLFSGTLELTFRMLVSVAASENRYAPSGPKPALEERSIFVPLGKQR